MKRINIFGLLSIVISMCFMTFYIWECIYISSLFFQNLLLRIIFCGVLFFLGSFFIFPLMSLIVSTLTVIFAWFLNLLFSLKMGAIRKQYEKIPEWLRWVLLFPFSAVFPLSVGFVLSVFYLGHSRIVGMLSFLFAIYSLAPRFKNYFVVGSIILQMILSVIAFLLVFISRKITPTTITEICVELLLWVFSWGFYFWILKKKYNDACWI